MSYPVFLIIGISIAGAMAVALAGPLSALSVIGFWAAHYFFLNWRHNNASLASMSESELSDVLDWWTGGGPFGRNLPDLSRVRARGRKDELATALKRVIAIHDEKIRRAQDLGFSTSGDDHKRQQLLDELLNLSKEAS